MPRLLVPIFTLGLVGVACAQAPAPRHFRLAIAIANGQDPSSRQNFVLDVPVSADRVGEGEVSLSAGPAGEASSASRQTLRCTAVHASPKGVAAHISYTRDSVSPEPLPGSAEHVVSHFVFEQQVDLPLGVETEVADPARLKPLGGEARKPAPLRLSVTATEL